MKKLIHLAILVVWAIPIGLQAFASPKVSYAAAACTDSPEPPKPTTPSAGSCSESGGARIRTARFLIEGMKTKACPVLVKAAVGKLDGVKKVSADAETKTAWVDYDPAVVSPEEIQNVILVEAGFKSKIVAR